MVSGELKEKPLRDGEAFYIGRVLMVNKIRLLRQMPITPLVNSENSGRLFRRQGQYRECHSRT